MSNNGAGWQNELAEEILQGLEPRIKAAVSSASEDIAAKIALDKAEQEKRLDQANEEIASLKEQNDHALAQLASTRSENDMLRKNLVALLETKSHANAETDRKSPVPYPIYEKVVEKLETLQTQLLKSMEQRKLEAAARSYLMRKMKLAKAAAREWKEYHERWITKHADCTSSNLSRAPPIDHPDILSGTTRASSRPPPLSPSEETFERHFHHPTQLGDSGPQDAIHLSIHPGDADPTHHLIHESDSDSVLDMLHHIETSLTTSSNVKPTLHQEPLQKDAPSSDSTDSADSPHAVPDIPEVSETRLVNYILPAPKTSITDSCSSRQYNQPRLKPAKSKSNSPVRIKVLHDDDIGAIDQRCAKRQKPTTHALDLAPHIKDEPLSSSTTQSVHPQFLRCETLDLDQVTGTVATPRKRKYGQSVPSISHSLHGKEWTAPRLPLAQTLRLGNRILLPADTNTPKKPTARLTHEQDRDMSTKSTGKHVDTPAGTRTKRTTLKPVTSSRSAPKPARLRDKPLSSLELSDFKYNDGIDHNKLADNPRPNRECLPGCTDARCCGEAMRKLAHTLQPKLARPPFPASQEDASLSDDEYLIKWFLGSRWDRASITLLDPPAYSSLLLDARTSLLALRHGKHRSAEPRRMSPPGFWDVDMPTTQDLQAQRATAHEITRALVRHRYDEALRNGRWMFRDEVDLAPRRQTVSA